MKDRAKRRFSKRQRLAAWLSQDGRSAISGRPLGENFHADHRLPWSKGGSTSMDNCDAILPSENLAKGARMTDRRFVWQDEFFRKWIQCTDPNLFLCALPGGGKTRASIRIIKAWLEQGGIFIVVVPTLPIKRNWRKQLEKFGIYADENFYGFLRDRYHGIIVTYAALHSLTPAFQKFCAEHAVLLVCDEIHHASENEASTWGVDLRNSFSMAKRRLLLSGTPVRSDKETTSFLTLEDFTDDDGKSAHRYKMDFCYDWPRALEDRVVRSLTFHREAMKQVEVQFPTKGLKTFSDKDDAWLNYALDDKNFLLKMLQDAIDKLEELRKSDPTAGAMAIAKNIPHAKLIFDLLGILGQRPIIVTSAEEEDSVDVIAAFDADHSKKWIISVKQVSEGVDIPRLRVLVYSTYIATDLAFRQFVGRVVRRRDHELDEQAQAHVFLPETPRLTKVAEKIEKLQALAFKKPGNGEPPTKAEIGMTIGGAEPEFLGYIIHGREYIGDRKTVIGQLMQKYKVSEMSAAIMLDDPEFATPHKRGDIFESSSESLENPPWIDEELLRTDCNDLTSKLIKIRQLKRGHGERYDRKIWETLAKEVHFEFMIDNVPQKKMSVSQLQRKKEKLLEAIMREQNA